MSGFVREEGAEDEVAREVGEGRKSECLKKVLARSRISATSDHSRRYNSTLFGNMNVEWTYAAPSVTYAFEHEEFWVGENEL